MIKFLTFLGVLYLVYALTPIRETLNEYVDEWAQRRVKSVKGPAELKSDRVITKSHRKW